MITIKKLVPLILVAIVGFIAWRMFGGASAHVPNAPGVGVPDVQVPGPGDVETGAKKGSDWLANLPGTIWTFVVPMLIVVSVLYWIWKDPKRRSLALGVAVVALLIYVVSLAG